MNILNGGFGPNYPTMSTDEKAIRVDASGARPPFPKVDLTKHIPKEHVTTLRACVEEFRQHQRDLEDLSVSQVAQWHALAKKAAVQAENALLAPANTNETKNRLRSTRRELNHQFKDKWYAKYHEAICAVLDSVNSPIEKLIVSEDADDAKRLKAYGLPQTQPCPIVASLLGLRTHFKERADYFGRMKDHGHNFFSLSPDTDLMAQLGISV